MAFAAVAGAHKKHSEGWHHRHDHDDHKDGARRGSHAAPMMRAAGAAAGSEAEVFLAKWAQLQRETNEAQLNLLRGLLASTGLELSPASTTTAGGKAADKATAEGTSPPSTHGFKFGPTDRVVELKGEPPDVLPSPRGVLSRTDEPPAADAARAPGNSAESAGAEGAAGVGGAPPPPPPEPVELSKQWDEALDGLEDIGTDDDVLDRWRRCSGLQTVEKWCANYRKHPAGWGALLMIHGIPEVTGRLRSKVENFAIYSALFLSVSMGMVTGPPEYMSGGCDTSSDFAFYTCSIIRRCYFYALALGVAAHMLSILLAMGFVNVLNEAARDSDVIRMFARGKGFLATVKCERWFVVGCVADFLAIIVAAGVSIGWEMVIVSVLLCAGACFILRKTTTLLATSAGIVEYWRPELGGKPDENDPYDLTVPLTCLQKRAKFAFFGKSA